MKIYTNITATFVAILFLLSFGMKSEAVASCPSGTSSTTMIFNIGGCDWMVDICYKCPFTANPSWFTFTKYKKVHQTCICSVPENEILDSVTAQMLDGRMFLYGLCAGTIPPCGTTNAAFQIRVYDCWFMRNIFDVGLEYVVCDYSSWCVQDVEICWDQTYGPQYFPSGVWYPFGDSYCETIIMPDTPPPGSSSSCWFNSTCGQ